MSATSARRVVRVRHEPRRRDVAVARVDRIAPHYVGITFAGEALGDFASPSFDDHLKLFFEDASGATVGRHYTPRRFNREARELTLEFALHGDSPTCRWVRAAVQGRQAVVGGPRSSMLIPDDYDWHLLAGDLTALPAIARRLEELPRGAKTLVVVEAPPSDRPALAGALHGEVRWVGSTEALLAEVRAWAVPHGAGFAWAAGEAAAMRALREVLVRDKELPREALRVAAYWKRGAADHHENLDD